MTLDDNMTLARRFNEEVFNQGNFDAIDMLFSPDYVNHTAPQGIPAGNEGTRMFAAMFRGAFPDGHITADDVMADGDLVYFRWTATGTHEGAFSGIPATGKAIRFTGMDIVRVANGKIVEHWDEVDRFGLLRQLGVFG